MGRHSAARRPRVRAAAVVALAGAGLIGGGGVGHAEAELVEGTPCTEAARACVSLDDGEAWLIEDGEVVRSATISAGGDASPTPRGDFAVQWKNRDHRSQEFDGAPMPYAVFFAPGGIAFHEGNLERPSAGCVRLSASDAAAFFEFLQVGDRVEVR